MFTFVFNWQVLMPLLAEVTFNAGPREFGLLSAGAGVGAFIGAITTAHANHTPDLRRMGLFAVVVGVTMFFVAGAPTLPLAILAMVPLGYGAMCFMITGNTLLQLTARPQARGRVMALYGMVFLGSTPIGAPLAGWLGQAIGPRAEFAVMGSLAILVGATVMGLRRRAAKVAELDLSRSGPRIAAR
jgi:MFS family permease